MKRYFTLTDQEAFAVLSGDYNPIHIKPLIARRLLYGQPIVHGIHIVLWALDKYLQQKSVPVNLLWLKATFNNAIGVGQEVSCIISESVEYEPLLRIYSSDLEAVKISVAMKRCEGQIFSDIAFDTPAFLKPKTIAVDDIYSICGELKLQLDARLVNTLFPILAKYLPKVQIATIVTTTRLIGMECPGLNSIYSQMELAFQDAWHGCKSLSYEVSRFDKRISLATIDLESEGIKGSLKAFIRPEPSVQDSYCKIETLVEKGEFSSQTALIVGGTRGLGEVTAKLLAAGGADVTITYYKGINEAKEVVNEIQRGGGKASHVELNVLSPASSLLKAFPENRIFSDLYYFATPFIFSASRGNFSIALFSKFCDYYIAGFLKLIKTLKKRDNGLKRAFYPSTVAIDEMPPNMGEYAAAKIAGESLCRFLEKTNRGLRIYQARLPRMGTDQTVSILSVINQKPAPIILEHLHKMTY